MQSSEVIAVHRAKRTRLQLVQRAASREAVLIGRTGHAITKLTRPDAPVTPKRRLGFLTGKVNVP